MSEFSGQNFEYKIEMVSNVERFINQVETMKDTINHLIDTEKGKIVDQKLKLQENFKTFQEHKREQLEKLNKAKEDIVAENLSLGMNNNNEEESKLSSDIIELDVGGTHMIATARTTLTKFPSSDLGSMFSGKHKLNMHNGRVFL